MKAKEIINLTPHTVNVRPGEGMEFSFPPSGTVARVATREGVVGALVMTGDVPILVVRQYTGRCPELPPFDPDMQRVYIVSRMVLDAHPERPDLVAPDTGPTAIRDEEGRIRAVTRFLANW